MTSHLLDGIPIYELSESTVSAEQYNFVLIALKRLKGNIRIELPRLRTLDLILEHDAWIVVDRSLNDIPVLAWTGFQVHHRDNLHQAIPCQLRLYHAHGKIIITKVIEAMNLILGERLADMETDSDEKTGTKIVKLPTH